MRTRKRARGLYQILTLLAIQALEDDAVPAEIRDLHIKHLKSPVHPKAVYPTLSSMLKKHYVIKHRKTHQYEQLEYKRRTWRYAITEAGHTFIADYFEEVDTMRRLATKFKRAVNAR